MSEIERPTQSSEERSGGLSSRLIRAGQVAGAITALVTAGVLVWTQLGPGGPPPVLRADVTGVKTYAPRTEYDYFNSHPGVLERERAHFHAQGLEEAETNKILRKSGVTVEFTVDIEAPAGREFKLTETLYRASAEEPISTIFGNFPNERFVVRASRYRTTESGWIEYPTRPGAYFVEIGLVDKEDHNAGPPGRSATFHVPRRGRG
jgi:hypothetical protein